MNHNAPDPSWILEEEICERCRCLIMTGEYRETRYGATWCGGCCNSEDTSSYPFDEEDTNGDNTA